MSVDLHDPHRNVGDPPIVSGFTPNSGPVGTQVTINGSNFTGVIQVNFIGASAQFTFVDDSTIIAWVPSGATNGPISVRNGYGTGTSIVQFTVTGSGGGGGGGGGGGLPPRIDSINPTSGYGGDGTTGTQVEVYGANFTQEPITVKFNGVVAYKWVHDSGHITTWCPTGGADGYITVTTAYGTCQSPVVFTDPPAPDCQPCSLQASLVAFAQACTNNQRIGYSRCDLDTNGKNFFKWFAPFCCDCSSYNWLLRYWSDGYKMGGEVDGVDVGTLSSVGRNIGSVNPAACHTGDLCLWLPNQHSAMFAWVGGKPMLYEQGGCGCCDSYACGCCKSCPKPYVSKVQASSYFCARPSLNPFRTPDMIRRPPGL